MFVTKLGRFPVILGIPWSKLHDVAVQFATNTVTFGPQYCTTYCHDAPVMVQGVNDAPPELVYRNMNAIFEPQICPQRPFWGTIVILNGYHWYRQIRRDD